MLNVLNLPVAKRMSTKHIPMIAPGIGRCKNLEISSPISRKQQAIPFGRKYYDARNDVFEL